ncbi:MAG: hypothetical protein M3342_20340 [Bacteroidota bacterium]|nr:hypothetical protein [Flavisolibacter sp.]MDQ3846333.1 hypothetical protein [Bacteroidota bacterium]
MKNTITRSANRYLFNPYPFVILYPIVNYFDVWYLTNHFPEVKRGILFHLQVLASKMRYSSQQHPYSWDSCRPVMYYVETVQDKQKTTTKLIKQPN